MDYISTRGGAAVSAGTAILKGIADDGGLYVPSSFPIVTSEELKQMAEMEYYERAASILSKFLTDYDKEALKDFCFKAYSRFGGDAAPLIKVDDETYMLELWHGPTLAFKDMALTLLPYLMTAAREKEGSGKKTLILVATSGDTGKAALEGFADVPGTEVIVFYPSEGVSLMQKLQMQTADGKNVHAVGIQGNFDDAQSAVKAFFQDKEAVRAAYDAGYTLSSANSINWGRLCPQIAYYISAYADLLSSGEIEEGEKINFVVPTGNFGNILAAYYAKRMGLPINKLIVASNTNNVLTDFFRSGKYDVNRKFFKTISPSMDILISSNLERLLFEFEGRNPQKIKDLMTDLSVYGSYKVDKNKMDEALSEFAAYWSDEDETAEAADNFFDMFGYLLDPHTAVGVAAYYTYVTDTSDESKTVITATANPYKFAGDVYQILTGKNEKDAFRAARKLQTYTGEEAPEQITELLDLPVIHTLVIPKDKIKDTILDILKNIKE